MDPERIARLSGSRLRSQAARVPATDVLALFSSSRRKRTPRATQFPAWNAGGSHRGPGHIITFSDSNFQKTIATANNRPVNDADDAFLGYDQSDSNPSNVGISLGAPKSISSYIENVGDGKNWLERLTANLKSLRVPLTTDSLITSTVPPGTPPLSVTSATQVANLTLSNHPRLQACGTTASCAASAAIGGQIVFGSVTLAHGEATVKGFSPSFKTADSFQCTASDRTIAVNAGNAVAVSGSSIVVRGTGNDVIAYMRAGT